MKQTVPPNLAQEKKFKPRTIGNRLDTMQKNALN